ncbi:MAG: PilZ domain-containing protein [Gammaproteobacteria bacterium]
MLTERRSYPRNEVIINVDVQVLGGRVYEGCARNVSMGGISVDLYGDPPPNVAAKAEIKFIIWTGDEKIYRDLLGNIIRSSEGSVALVFDDESEKTKKTIKEVMYYQQFERRKKPRPRN